MQLNAKLVRKVRRLHDRGASGAALARQFGVAQQTMSKVLTGATWGHLDAERDAAAVTDPRAHALFRSFSPSLKEWVVRALAAVRKLAAKLDVFTTDDVWQALGDDLPEDPRAIGGVMKIASFEAVCSSTDQVVVSKRRACHGRPIRVWQSEI